MSQEGGNDGTYRRVVLEMMHLKDLIALSRGRKRTMTRHEVQRT